MTLRQPRFLQLHRPDAAAERAELIAGLLREPACVSPKHFYDALGSVLFQAITALPEYTATRDEAAIFDTHGPDIARAAGAAGVLVDLGAGDCAKAARLMPLLEPSRYVAVDISADFLHGALRGLQRAHPSLDVMGLGLDLSRDLALPAEALAPGEPALFFYPGSSIGNFRPDAAAALLARIAAHGAGTRLLIGVDLVKPRAELESAYDDAVGVTAAFNRNLLRHVNRQLGSDFDPRRWQHLARFDEAAMRVEMHLEALEAQTVRWPGGERRFARGERLHTEDSCKYRVSDFAALLHRAGFGPPQVWCSPGERFAVFLAEA